MPDTTAYPEPPNQSIVAWLNTGTPVGIYQRDDSAAAEARYVDDSPLMRWFRLDVEDVSDYGPMTWDDIFDEGDDGPWMGGPFLLKPEPLLAAEAVTSRG